MAWVTVILKGADIALKQYHYALRMSAIMADIMSFSSFGNFVLTYSDDLNARRKWLAFYEKACRGYSHFVLIPCLLDTHKDDIARDPNLRDFYHNWIDYKEMLDQYEQAELLGEGEPEPLIAWIHEVFKPVLEITARFTGSINIWLQDVLGSVMHALWQIIKQKNFDMVFLLDTLIQRYRKYGREIGIKRVPQAVWYSYRPTLDFDIITLFAHVEAYQAYKSMLERDITAQTNKPISTQFRARIKIADQEYQYTDMSNVNKVCFFLTNYMLETYKGEKVIFEVG